MRYMRDAFGGLATFVMFARLERVLRPEALDSRRLLPLADGFSFLALLLLSPEV